MIKGSPKIHILLVDDEKSMEIIFKHKLKQWITQGLLKMTFVMSGVEAMNVLQTEKVDLILCDISMPVMSGFELLTQIKKNYSETPIFIVSGHVSSDFKELAADGGAWKYFEKPINFDKLISSIIDELPELKQYC